MDGLGSTIITWQQWDGSNWQVFKSEYRNGNWTNPSSLADNISPDGTDAVCPQVAMASNGAALIAWQQVAYGAKQIFKSEFRGGTWTHPSGLTDHISQSGTDADCPQVAMNNVGNALVVWSQPDGTSCGGQPCRQVFKSEYRSSSWHHPTSLSDNISPDGYATDSPQAAMDNNGNALVVWEQLLSGGGSGIFKSEYRNNTWTNPSSITDFISPGYPSPAYLPYSAMDDLGTALIGWQEDAGSYQMFLSEYSGGIWHHPATTNDHISVSGSDVTAGPKIAMGGDGSHLVVWWQNDGSHTQIFKSEYRGSWVNPSSLMNNISPDGTDAQWPQVTMNATGDSIIVWQQSDGFQTQIFKSEYRDDVWRHPTSLTDNISPDGSAADSPAVAIDDNGNTIVVWQQWDGSTAWQIYKSEYRRF